MKIRINDFGVEIKNRPIQEFDEGFPVTFEAENGDRYHITPSEMHGGISIRLTRNSGHAQMSILPRMSNVIDVL